MGIKAGGNEGISPRNSCLCLALSIAHSFMRCLFALIATTGSSSRGLRCGMFATGGGDSGSAREISLGGIGEGARSKRLK